MQDSPTPFQGSIRRRSLQGSPPVIVSPVFSAPNSTPATPQHPSHLPAGATVLPSPAVALHQANPEFIPRKYLAAQAYYKLQQQSNGSAVSDDLVVPSSSSSSCCDVPSAPLKFGPGFDSPQRAAAPPSRSHSPCATPRRSPGRSSSVQSSSPSPSPSPSLNGVPIRWAPIRSPIHKRQTSSLSSLSSDASFNQQSPLRVDERAIDCGRPVSDPQGNAKPESPVPLPRRGRKEGEASPSNNKPPRASPARPKQQGQGVRAPSPRGTAPFNNNNVSAQPQNPTVANPAYKPRPTSPANSEASSKNDESVIFRRVTIKKKLEPSTQTNETPTRRFTRTECEDFPEKQNGQIIALCLSQPPDSLKVPSLNNRYPDLLTSSNLVHFDEDLRSSTSTLISATDMESNCSASPMIRRLQAQIRARASFRMACSAPLSCSSEDDRDATLTREATPPPHLAASSEKILPEDYQLVFITTSDSSSDLSDCGGTGNRKRRRKKKRSTLKVKSRLQIGSGACYIEDSDWEFTSDSDYRMVASLCSLDEISDVEENIKEKAKIIEKKSASLEDLPSLFTRTGSVRLKRNNSVRRSVRKSMRLKNNPTLMKKRAEESPTTRECHKCGGMKSRPVANAHGTVVHNNAHRPNEDLKDQKRHHNQALVTAVQQPQLDLDLVQRDPRAESNQLSTSNEQPHKALENKSEDAAWGESTDHAAVMARRCAGGDELADQERAVTSNVNVETVATASSTATSNRLSDDGNASAENVHPQNSGEAVVQTLTSPTVDCPVNVPPADNGQVPTDAGFPSDRSETQPRKNTRSEERSQDNALAQKEFARDANNNETAAVTAAVDKTASSTTAMVVVREGADDHSPAGTAAAGVPGCLTRAPWTDPRSPFSVVTDDGQLRFVPAGYLFGALQLDTSCAVSSTEYGSFDSSAQCLEDPAASTRAAISLPTFLNHTPNHRQQLQQPPPPPLQQQDSAPINCAAVSSLEKYFTEELLIPQQNFDCFEDYDSDYQEPPVPPAQGYLIEEEILSDVSTSSDDLYAVSVEQAPVLPPPTMYGNPHAFSLHTIVEDSCEESEHSTPNSPQVQRQPSDLEQYFSYAIANATEDEQKRWSVVSEDLSDTVSEASYVSEVMEEDPSMMASSRLEKYFTNLVGGCTDTLSSRGEFLADEPEPNFPSGFEEETFNTIKRNKKTKDEVAVFKVNSGEQFVRSERRSDTAKQDNAQLASVKKQDSVKENRDENEEDQVAKMDIDDEDDDGDEADMAKVIDVVEKTPSPQHPDSEIETLQTPLKAIRLAEQLENIAITGKMKHEGDVKMSVKERITKMNSMVEQKNAINKPKVAAPAASAVAAAKKSSPDTAKKVSFKKDEEISNDEEVAYVVNRVIAHISGSPDADRPSEKIETPAWKALLENQIVSLMQSVSPYNGSTSSTVASSNNSDYGSDTLESEEYGTNENGDDPATGKSAHSEKDVLTDETLFICKKLMTSLKQLSSKSPSPPLVDEYAKAQEYIQDQIVALMHTVTASRNASPMLKDRKKSLDSTSLSEKQSESGSETVSASISIPSYDSDETTATEPVNNQEMEDLYNMLSDNVSLSKLSCCDDETDHRGMALPKSKTLPVASPRKLQSSNKVASPSPVQIVRISPPSAKYDSTSTLTTSSDTDFAGSVETVLEVKTNSPEPELSDMSRSEPSLYIKAKKVAAARNADHLSNKLGKNKTVVKDDPSLAKSVSEHNLFVAASSEEASVHSAKSVGSIVESHRSRDTGYYSFKSSDESVEHDLTRIPETSTEPVRPARSARNTGGNHSSPVPPPPSSSSTSSSSVQQTTSTPNIHEAFANGRFLTLPLKPKRTEVVQEVSSMTLKPNKEKHFSSTFFSTSGVLRKLTLKADDSNGSPLRSARFRGARKGPPGAPGSDVESGASTDNLHQMGVFSKSQTSLSTLGNLSVSHPGGRSESMTSVYSAAGGGRYGTVDITGEVNFGLSYDLKQGVLNVQIKECKNLAAVDEKRNRSDPYVKVYLLPDRSKAGKRKTKVRKHTLSPVFNETLRFSVERSELTSRTLWLSVWHSDMFGRNDFLGEVMKDLSSDMLETNTTHWYPLQERMDPLDGASNVAYKGDLMLSLKFAPHDHRPGKGSLHVIVKEASNLQATRSNGTSDPFCKCYLLPDRHKSGKQKTAVVRRSVAPVWNHPFVYHDVSVDELKERCLELTIWDYDKITSNDFLGGVRLCLGTGRYQGITVDWMDSQGEEIRLWRQMLEKPNQWIDGCLHLRSSMN